MPRLGAGSGLRSSHPGNTMHAKGFRSFLVLVIIIVSPGCDNVEFEGFQFELVPPAPAAPPPTEAEQPDSVPAPLVPLDLGPVVYLLERGEGSAASLIAVAELSNGEYTALPEPEDVPDLIPRFAVGRLEEGSEFEVFSRGIRVGTFIADGSSDVDASTCRLRPRAGGRLEVRPELTSQPYFLAISDADLDREDRAGPNRSAVTPPLPTSGSLSAASVTSAQIVLQTMNIPWPSSIPQIRMDLQPLVVDGEGAAGFAATFVYGGALEVGPAPPTAYGVFVVSEPGATRHEPLVAWYQRSGPDGKAFPRLLGAQDLLGTGRPDLVLEVFGGEARWLAILGSRDDEWSVLYQDPCGVPAARGGIRSFR